MAAAQPAFALETQPFASFGLGIAVLDGDIGQVNTNFNRYEDDDGELIRRDFRSDVGLAISIDGGVAFSNLWRAGLFAHHSLAFEQKFGHITLS